ncbi:hypothetical protein [Shewanella surugensis]|uniref:Phage baseplate assembly protein V n=1 Tax=Shewanella surugensis TaxID=212020 RepID=A0ABT0LC03_9GAMM|nr:hypothetical protein [Shewanella surugensis]MCL1125213.1 hypothetical protein [Shewanella surugensis]
MNFGAGYSAQQYIALVGIASTDFPFVGDNAAEVITHFGDKCSQVWDMDAGTLIIQAAEKITLESKMVLASQDLQVQSNINAGGDITDNKASMAADRLIYNGHIHGYTDDGVDMTTAITKSSQ